jgi:hypothetical protein
MMSLMIPMVMTMTEMMTTMTSMMMLVILPLVLLPLSGLLGIGCHRPAAEAQLQAELKKRNLSLEIVVRPNWYF